MIRLHRQHGFAAGRLIALSKTGYCRSNPAFRRFQCPGLYPAWADGRTGRFGSECGCDPHTSAAEAASRNFYVLYETFPNPFWTPGSTPMRRVLRSVVWWTRTRADDSDLFLPLTHRPRLLEGHQLTCAVGRWQGRPAYSLGFWDNPTFATANTGGAAVILCGDPPKGLRVIQKEMGSQPERCPLAKGVSCDRHSTIAADWSNIFG